MGIYQSGKFCAGENATTFPITIATNSKCTTFLDYYMSSKDTLYSCKLLHVCVVIPRSHPQNWQDLGHEEKVALILISYL